MSSSRGMRPPPGISPAKRGGGFSLLEAVIAVMVFGLLMLAVGLLWNTTWRASERIATGGEGEAGAVFALRRVAEAFGHAVCRPGAGGLYAWQGEDDGGGAGEADRVSFVTSLPPDSAEGNPAIAPLERVKLSVETGPRGSRQLVMSAGPLTMEENDWQRRTVLLDGVAAFRLRYWSPERKDWLDGWRDAEKAPGAVQVSLARKGDRVDPGTDAWPLRAVARLRTPPVADSATNSPSLNLDAGSASPASVR